MSYRKMTVMMFAFFSAAQATAQTGLRAEAHLGWDHPAIFASVSDGTTALSGQESKDGLLYGVELGYDARLNDFDLGVYGGFDGASTGECVLYATGDEACLKAGRNWSLGVRAGYFVSDNILAYVKGGYANGSVKLDYRDATVAANDFTVSDNMDGYQVGGGIQVGLGPNLYAKLEYVRTDYKDYDVRSGTYGALVRVDRDNLVYGMGFRF